MAQQLIESLSADFDPSKFKDNYRERVLDLIERKAAGEEIAVQPEAEESGPAPDLMAALEASLADIRGDADDDKDKPGPKKAAAKPRKSANGSGSKAGSGSGSKAGAKSKSAGSNGGQSKSRSKAKS
jgi:DNA end-binding protein Ku